MKNKLMLYFAYGSNLNHKQMHIRCKDSRYIKSAFLEDYKLSFCAPSKNYGVANIVKKKGSKVPGGIWEISESDEKELDIYEGYPTLYAKDFFNLNGEKVMFYIMKRRYSFKLPRRSYVDTISQGYVDCNLDTEYLKRRLTYYNIAL